MVQAYSSKAMMMNNNFVVVMGAITVIGCECITLVLGRMVEAHVRQLMYCLACTDALSQERSLHYIHNQEF